MMIQLFKSFVGCLIVESTVSAFDGDKSHGLHVIFSGKEIIHLNIFCRERYCTRLHKV